MPSNPDALMRLAAKVNGLTGPGMKPWHLKAQYKIFENGNKRANEGTFEEWWAGPEKYKLSYLDKKFKQVRYRTAAGLFMTGMVKEWPPMADAMVEKLLVHPLPTVEQVRARKYIAHKAKFGTTPLECVQALAPWQSTEGPLYCFDHDIPVIRVETPYNDETTALLNDIVQANGRYVAKQIKVKFLDPTTYQNLYAPMSTMDVEVTTLEPLQDLDDAGFAPPASAAPAPSEKIPGWMKAGKRISGDKPDYPAIAKAAHIQGTVVIRATISAEGAVTDARVVSGPEMLRVAALNAVRTWRYEPFFWNGEAYASEQLIPVVFRLP